MPLLYLRRKIQDCFAPTKRLQNLERMSDEEISIIERLRIVRDGCELLAAQVERGNLSSPEKLIRSARMALSGIEVDIKQALKDKTAKRICARSG